MESRPGVDLFDGILEGQLSDRIVAVKQSAFSDTTRNAKICFDIVLSLFFHMITNKREFLSFFLNRRRENQTNDIADTYVSSLENFPTFHDDSLYLLGLLVLKQLRTNKLRTTANTKLGKSFLKFNWQRNFLFREYYFLTAMCLDTT